ncbi:MAG: RNA-binding domain-containing protein [Chthoniobacteraceae bacterium]
MTPIERQLKDGESATVEFASQTEPFEKIVRSVVAFLNSGGGTVFIGVDDGGQIMGVPEAQKVASELFTRLQSAISPKALFSVAREEVGTQQIVVIEVPGGLDTPFVADGTLFLRKGSQTTKATGEDLQRLLQKRAVEVERWERRGSPALSADDLDAEEIKRTVQQALADNRYQFTNAEGVEAPLKQLGMWTRGMLTNAADVCFGKQPARRNPQVRVRAFAFESDKAGDYIDQADLSGPIAQVIEQSRGFIRRNSPLAARFQPRSLERENVPSYPEYAIREGLVNALAHRDYAAFSSGTSVTVYPDRVEIWNSGQLPKGWRADKLRHNHPSLPANPDIAHVLFIRSFMERIGRGTLKIIEACRQALLPAPKWSVDADGITLTLYSHASEDAAQRRLNDRQRSLLESLKAGEAISAAGYAEKFAVGVVERQARRDLRELEDADLLRREGKAKATVYVRTQRVWSPVIGT